MMTITITEDRQLVLSVHPKAQCHSGRRMGKSVYQISTDRHILSPIKFSEDAAWAAVAEPIRECRKEREQLIAATRRRLQL